MTISYIVSIGMYIKPTTYFKLMYPIYTGINEYGVLHIAIFGMN